MKTKAWHRSIGAWLFLPTLYFVGMFFNKEWLTLSLFVYLAVAITITSGYHRLFNHMSYQCNKIWHYVFGFIGCASLNSSPVEWSTVHTQHHRYSDTENDPYESNFKYYLRFKDRTGIKATKREVRMMQDSMHRFFVKHSLSIALVTMLLCSLNPMLFLYGYALPVTAYLVTAGLQTIFSHGPNNVRNLWLLEFLIPMAGEWLHGVHHDNASLNNFSTKPYYLDIGGLFIKAIRNVKSN